MERRHRPAEVPADVHHETRPERPKPAADGGAGGPFHAGLLDPSLITAVQRQAGNAAATALVRREPAPTPVAAGTVQRQRGGRRRGGATAPTAMARAEFETEAARNGVGQVVTGTLDQQVSTLNAMSGPDNVGDVLRTEVTAGTQQWASWDPGASSPVYRAILRGLADFATAMGGLPPIRQIVFYKRGYQGVRVGGQLRTGWDPAGADYSGGVMSVYENAVLQATAKVLPTARDASGSAAASDRPTQEQGIGRVITHELGHGLQEVAHDPAAVRRAAGPLLMDRYARDIGWRRAPAGAREWRLYDVGDPTAKAALDAGQLPEDRYRITTSTWQQGWHEQPISRYQVSAGPFEDFPEAVMAFIANRRLLQQRSPARYDFVQSVISELAGRLHVPSAPAAAPTGAGGGT